MASMIMVVIGFVAGFFAMTIVSFYKWFFEIWNGGLK